MNNKNHLTINGADTVELANEYGTPLYIMDEELIRENMRSYKQSMHKFYNNNGLVCYASKAFSCKQIYRIAKEEGLGIDVVSAGELYTALTVGFDTSKICYHGNNKTEFELNYAIDSDVLYIVCDNIEELYTINKIGEEKNKKVNVLLRVTPGVDA
ncbi:MAG: diaminopimelate decarboxylase, partial [Oscillospiraceae bacterium]